MLDGILTYDDSIDGSPLSETPFATSMPVTCGCWVEPPAKLAVAPFQPDIAGYAIEADVQVTSSDVYSSFGITARDGAVTVALNGGSYAVPFLGMEELPGRPFEPGTDWHTYRLEVQGSTARFLIDGALALEFTSEQSTSGSGGHVGLYSQLHQINVRNFRLIALTIMETGQAEAILPSEFGGSWTGTVQQYADDVQGARESTFPVELSLTAGSIGPLVGTFNYPSLGCGGDLTWLGITLDSVALGESITYDDTTDGGSCTVGGSMILRFVDDQTLAWTWFWPDGTQRAEATLRSKEARKVAVFVEGLSSSLSEAQVRLDASDTIYGNCAEHDPVFGDVKKTLLDLGFTCADFLRYSYTGGTLYTDTKVPAQPAPGPGEILPAPVLPPADQWQPKPYSCDQTGQSLDMSVTHLVAMLSDYRQAHPEVEFVLIGHSLGGVLAMETVRQIGIDPGLPPNSIAAVITIDSPLNRLSDQNTDDIQATIFDYVKVTCQGRLFLGAPVMEDLAIATTSDERRNARTEYEVLVTSAQAQGVRFMTVGNAEDCVYYLSLCGISRFTLPGDWFDDRATMIIDVADKTELYSLGTQGCDLTGLNFRLEPSLVCLGDPHGAALHDKEVIEDFHIFVAAT